MTVFLCYDNGALAGSNIAGLVHSGIGDAVAAGLAQVQAGGIHSYVAFSVGVIHCGYPFQKVGSFAFSEIFEQYPF